MFFIAHDRLSCSAKDVKADRYIGNGFDLSVCSTQMPWGHHKFSAVVTVLCLGNFGTVKRSSARKTSNRQTVRVDVNGEIEDSDSVCLTLLYAECELTFQCIDVDRTPFEDLDRVSQHKNALHVINHIGISQRCSRHSQRISFHHIGL